MVLLGDIHKRQFLNEEETIAYPGSLIQQNYSEEPSHGFLLWDVEKRKATYHQVENDYGYKILKVENGEISFGKQIITWGSANTNNPMSEAHISFVNCKGITNVVSDNLKAWARHQCDNKPEAPIIEKIQILMSEIKKKYRKVRKNTEKLGKMTAILKTKKPNLLLMI